MSHFELIPAYDDININDYKYQTEFSSGIDLKAYLDLSNLDELMSWNQDSDGNLYHTIHPHDSAIINTGLRIKFYNKDLEAQVRSRSGLAAKTGLFVLNAPGTIDADYDGLIRVILFNPTNFPHKIYVGDRIAQLVICPVFRNEDYIKKVHRGEGGFGSTGV